MMQFCRMMFVRYFFNEKNIIKLRQKYTKYIKFKLSFSHFKQRNTYYDIYKNKKKCHGKRFVTVSLLLNKNIKLSAKQTTKIILLIKRVKNKFIKLRCYANWIYFVAKTNRQSVYSNKVAKANQRPLSGTASNNLQTIVKFYDIV